MTHTHFFKENLVKKAHFTLAIATSVVSSSLVVFLYAVVFNGLTSTIVLGFKPTIALCYFASVGATLLYEYSIWHVDNVERKNIWYETFDWAFIGGLMTIIVLAFITALVNILITPHLPATLYL